MRSAMTMARPLDDPVRSSESSWGSCGRGRAKSPSVRLRRPSFGLAAASPTAAAVPQSTHGQTNRVIALPLVGLGDHERLSDKGIARPGRLARRKRGSAEWWPDRADAYAAGRLLLISDRTGQLKPRSPAELRHASLLSCTGCNSVGKSAGPATERKRLSRRKRRVLIASERARSRRREASGMPVWLRTATARRSAALTGAPPAAR